MPFSPSERFDPTLGGIGAAQAIAEAWKKYQENQRVDSMNDAIMNHAVQTGYISLDDYNAYKAAPLLKRQGLANGAQANIMDDFRRQSQQAQMLAERAQAAQHYATANQVNADAQFSTPTSTSFLGPDGQPITMVQTAPRKFQPLKEVNGQTGDNYTPDSGAIDRARQAGYEWLPTGPKQGRWVQTNFGGYVPGNTAYDDAGNAIGAWTGRGTISRSPQPKAPDPLKQKIAEAMGTAPANPPASASIAPIAPPSPTVTPPPSAPMTAPNAAPPAAQQYPLGTRARKGDQWFVMTVNGWLAE